MFIYMLMFYKKTKYLNNKKLIYYTNRLKPIRLHNCKYLYFNQFTIIKNYFNTSKYYFNFKIWNFFNYTHILLINDFISFYVNNCTYSLNFSHINNINLLKYFICYNYKIILLLGWYNDININIYYYYLFNKFISTLCI